MSPFLTSGGQSIRVSALASLLPMKGQDWFPLTWTDWLDLLAVQGTLKSLLQPQFKSTNSSMISFLYSPTLISIHDYWKNHSFDSVQFTSVTQLCLTLCNPMNCSMPGLPVHHPLPESTQTHVHVRDATQPSHLLSSLSLLSIFPSIRVFSNDSALHIRWPKYWSFSFNISPSKEHPGLISFRMDWLDLLEVQGTLKSLLQHYSSKASILQHSTIFIVRLSQPHMTTGKTIALTRQTFLGRIMEDSWKINSVSKNGRTTVCVHECGCG